MFLLVFSNPVVDEHVRKLYATTIIMLFSSLRGFSSSQILFDTVTAKKDNFEQDNPHIHTQIYFLPPNRVIYLYFSSLLSRLLSKGLYHGHTTNKNRILP